ncbi:putative saccharopine dehydrogenase-like oxidoreductase [Nymphaea thermarum]|nr:putative saccharopine dehydrogenase-like oxidoreductase [Nymphaea thermarum]
MEEEKIDMVIFGASGFTGKYVVREALRFLNSPPHALTTIGLAGRNPAKVEAALRWATAPSPPPPLPIFKADVSDPSSLSSLCRRARLLLNCVGPYRLYGEPVVAACVEAGTDYLDITGEPEFMERMEAKYRERAAETGAIVVSACGFDSIPAEMGVLFNSRQWVPPSLPHSVEAYLVLESEKRIVGNIATLESSVLGLANVEELQKLRRSRPKPPKLQIPGPPPNKGGLLEHRNTLGLWAVKLPSADTVVVKRTLARLAENPHGLPGVNESGEHIQKRTNFWSTVRPVHFAVKMGFKSFWAVVRTIFVGIIIGLLSKVQIGRNLLVNYPEIFTLGWFRRIGPTEEEVRSATFKMWFVGHGYSDESKLRGKPDKQIITRVSGPEIGYATTPIALVQCALILLEQRGNLPKGGLFTPGVIFGPTNLEERLQENGISFDLISGDKVRS